jgi:2-polyprenyl-3-methyl-5-hydroxy-6-metoxy-1,4-benzoquinol methylase
LGYAGDYQILDWIYTRKTGENGKGLLWDNLFQKLPAAKAVRNRKDFFCKLFSSICAERGGKISVLDIASGSGRPIIGALSKCNPVPAKAYTYCIDHEIKAIEYSKRLKEEIAPEFNIIWDIHNIFRFKPERKFDFIWSGGLIEYLNERLSIALLKRMWNWIDSGGKLAFGIFHPNNPSRNWMEWCGEWFLIHRNKEDVLQLCEQAGIPTENIRFEFEPLGINLFTIIEKK